MIITAENIVHYLAEKNLITSESVVNGDFMVVDVTRRNRNFKILRKLDKGYFVKQIKNYDSQSISSLTREAHSYYLAQNDVTFKGLEELMPRLIHFDTMRNILILELFPESENLSEMHLRLGTFPEYIASSLGASLGTYHKNVSNTINEVRTKKVFPETLPWMLTINPQYILQIKNTDSNHFQFFSIIDKYPEFLTSIEQLRNEWQVNSLVHGDMKWDNCIVYKDADTPSENLKLKIIDWELADLGDSSWDVGAVFQTYLSLWVMSIPVTSQNNLQQSEQLTKYKIEDMQPAIKSFWNTYADTMSFDKATQTALLEKCSKYAAVRMIQTVYEQLHFTKQLTKNGIYLLQLSLNILKNPPEAITGLLGL
jgi:thiamine kinase-like enzyme